MAVVALVSQDCLFLFVHFFSSFALFSPSCGCASVFEFSDLFHLGKTTILYRLQCGEIVTTIPTIGFNVESLTYKNITLNVWDLGGQGAIRPYWRCYYADTNAVIFVVDSADGERLGTACEELHQMLQEEELKDAALLVFANKQDLPGAKSEAEVSEALQLSKLKGRTWAIYKASAVKGEGLTEGLDWLVTAIEQK